jgi:hypothetical protein
VIASWRVDVLHLLQWPAMIVTLLASYLVASKTERRREAGFWWFLASNVLWIVWGLFDGAYALVVLQVGLAAINIRGVTKNDGT